MPEEKVDGKTQDKDKKEETTEEDPFSDLFKEKEETETETTEEETTEDKTETKTKTKEKTPDVREVVKSEISDVEKRFERRAEVGDFLASDQGQMFSKYSKEIRKAALDPRFTNIPVSQLAAVILTPAAYSAVLTDARQAADREASDTFVAGGSRNMTVPEELKTIDPTSMSKEEFAKLKQDALMGKYRIKEK